MVEADIQLTERRQGGGVEQVRLLPGSPRRRAGYGGLGSLRYPIALSSTTAMQTVQWGGRSGSYVEIQQVRSDFLTLCEVKVYAGNAATIVCRGTSDWHSHT